MKSLKALRAQKHVSQQAVADYLEITRQAYSNYENGNRAPDNETLLKLGEYFDVSVDYLLRGDEEKKPTLEDEDGHDLSDIDREIIRLLQSLPPDRKQQGLDYLRYLASGAGQ